MSIPFEKSARERKIENVILENYDKYYRMAYSYVHNEADAADIVQNGAYKAILNCKSLRKEEYAAAWVYRIMHFYTIDLNTGERLALKDLFKEGADYITPISENIKEQMRAQMSQDETAFYVNEEGNVVISFNEGDVAPMYMGVVTFTIPDEALQGIKKETQ